MTGAPAVAPTALTQGGHLGLGETIVFGVVALVTAACGIGVLTVERAAGTAINVIGVIISLAILYIVNEPPFMGITQVVVHTDAVMTLAPFVIMLVGVGGDRPVGVIDIIIRRSVLILLGLGLADALTAAMWCSILPKLVGLKDDAETAPDLLAITLYHDHVVTMELTIILFIIATVDVLILAHRRRIRTRLSQRVVATGGVQDYAAKGAHPGQKPMPGVYASTNSAATPALDTQSEAVEGSVPQVLRAHGQGLGLSDVSPKMGLAQRSGTIISRLAGAGQTGRAGGPRDARRSRMPSMPGVTAPTAKQPILSDDGVTNSATPEQKKEK